MVGVKLSARGFRGFERYLLHLTGYSWSHPEGRSEITEHIRRTVTDDLVHGMTEKQRDQLGRAVSAVLGAIRVCPLFAQGWSVRSWRPGRGQPGARKIEGHGSRYYEWDRGGWIDHPYRLTKTEEGGKRLERFVSEPYSLDEQGLRALVGLIDEGWLVRVDADWSLHYPGTTLRVIVRRKEGN